MTRFVRPVVLALGVLVGAPAAARAGEPIMPLADVKAGMRCQGATVVRGVTPSSFDVEIIDVVVGDASARQPLLLVRVGGAAVDASGIAQGFSGSPVRCPGADGTLRIAGALAYSIGEYGDKVGLATPIESILGEPVDVPRSVPARPDLMARAVGIAEPLSFGGLSPRVAAAVQGAARQAGRAVYAVPAAPRPVAFPATAAAPGSSIAVGLATGDFTAGAIGTVSYVDGEKVWAFGHPLDSAGRRALFLQDAYVYTVINNPLASNDISSYKLAAPGRTIGTVTSDGINAVAGRLGAAPASFPMRVAAYDEDRKRTQVANLRIADERRTAGRPVGASPLTQVGPIAVAQLAYNALQGVPAQQSSQMCARIDLVDAPEKPLHFCNQYVGGGGFAGLVGGPMISDFTQLAAAVDAYNFGPVRIAKVDVNLRVRRDLRQAFILSAAGPKVVRRGRKVQIKLRVRATDGKAMTRTASFKVPVGTPRGRRMLVLRGTSPDVSGGGQDALAELFGALEALLDEPGADEEGPRTLKALRAEVAKIARFDGVTAKFPATYDDEDATSDGLLDSLDSTPDEKDKRIEAFRDPELRLSGTVAVPVRVR